MTRDEEAGAIGPVGGLHRLGELFKNRPDVSSDVALIAQQSSVP